MIIPWEKQGGTEEYFVCPRAPSTVLELRERMLRRAKVIEGSYAYGLIDDLYAAIFVRSLNLKADYEAYFAREYTTFGEYLRRRARLPRMIVAQLTTTAEESTGVYHVRGSYAFLNGAFGLEFLTQLLEDPPSGEAS